MKKSESGNYTVYEGSDPNSLHDYSQTIAKELENRDRQFEEEQENQNTTIESLQKENEEIKEENSRLKEDLNAFPTVNGSGEYVTLDTADSRFKEFKIFGKSWQETGDGIPSVETASEIKNISGNVNITISDRNLLNAEKIVKDSNNSHFVYLDENKNIVFTTGGIPVIVRPVKIKEKTEYTYILRCKSNTTSLNNINFVAKYTDGSLEHLSLNKRTDTNEFIAKFKTNKEKTLDYVYQVYTDSASTTLIADASMILEGDYSNVNIELNNAKKQTVIFPFESGQRLMEGDYLASDGIHHKRKQIVIDGTVKGMVSYPVVNSDTGNTTFSIPNMYALGVHKMVSTSLKDETPLLCSHLKQATVTVGYRNFDDQIGYWGDTSAAFVVGMKTSKVGTNTSSILEYFKNNPMAIEYELAKEEVEAYTEAQKEAWKQIENLRSYEGQTNIFSIDEISPSFEVTAKSNLSETLTSLDKKIGDIDTALDTINGEVV